MVLHPLLLFNFMTDTTGSNIPTGPTAPPIPLSGTPLPTTNTVEQIGAVVVSDIQTMADAAIDTAAESAQPWLLTPVIKQFFEWIVSKLTTPLTTMFGTLVSWGVIDTQIFLEKTGVSAALAALIAAEKKGDKDEIAKALKDFQAANSALDNNDGSAPLPK